MPNLQKKILVILVVAVLAGAGYFVATNKSLPKNFDILALINPSPFQKLEKAVDKTIGVDTLYVDYKTKVNSRMTIEGVTQNMTNNVDGYIAGSTDGKTFKIQMRIYNENTPGTSVVVDVIGSENGNFYVKGGQIGLKWQKYTKEEYESEFKESPPDASVYGFNIIGTIFSESKALLKSIGKDTVQKLSDLTEGDKAFSRYEAEISIVDFIEGLKQDKELDLSEESIKNNQAILKDAIIKTTFFVDKKTGYIAKLIIEGKNLTQIPASLEEEAIIRQLKISTQHDITLTAEFSRYNVATNIAAPDVSEIINP